MKKLEGGLNNVPGFVFSAVECGIRYSGRLDYALIVAENPCLAAGVFTTNKVCAAPVKLCRSNIRHKIKAVLINATNANACTGMEGYQNAETLTSDIAARLGSEPSSILMASTGIIGHQLPLEKMKSSHPLMVSSLSRDQGSSIARAIMTTDTVPKEAAVSFSTSKGEYVIAGCAKGAGMIAPHMATLLCFILTDAPVSRKKLQAIFRRCIDKTLNAITIDGDTSTNDTALLLGPAGSDPLSPRDLKAFEEALQSVLLDLSEQLVRDAEGATKLVKMRILNAKTQSDADKAARAVSQSLLVKTALFGRDPNWGRIAAAVGYSGAKGVKEETLSVFFESLPLLVKGIPAPFDKQEIQEILSRREYTITVDLGAGKYEAVMLTCDISFDYIKINAEYTT